MNDSFAKLLETLRTLRGKKGCAWDHQQTIESFTPYILEEAKEVAEAVEKKDYQELKAELGDLFYDVLHLAAIAEEQGHFQMKEILDSVQEKMVRRHPQVFDPNTPYTKDVKKIMQYWKEIKEEEKKQCP